MLPAINHTNLLLALTADQVQKMVKVISGLWKQRQLLLLGWQQGGPAVLMVAAHLKCSAVAGYNSAAV
jgi:hypothetical protein